MDQAKATGTSAFLSRMNKNNTQSNINIAKHRTNQALEPPSLVKVPRAKTIIPFNHPIAICQLPIAQNYSSTSALATLQALSHLLLATLFSVIEFTQSVSYPKCTCIRLAGQRLSLGTRKTH